jgi:hypothetical protein
MTLRGVAVRVEKAGQDRGRRYEIGVRLHGDSGEALSVLRHVAVAHA